jgi:hypothetical protein
MHPFPLEWFHGSPLRLDVLRAGSTITPLRDLARVFSHKPPIVSLDDGEGVVKFKHNGKQVGWLYRVLAVDPGDVYPHPRSSMPAGLEWLTKIDLKVELIGPTELRVDEFLDAAEIACLRCL